MALFWRSFLRKRAISLATTVSVAATSFVFAQGVTSPDRMRAMPIQYIAGRNVAARPDISNEVPFLSENQSAMNGMMADMSVKPTGDADRDFVAMMVPHHQSAVDMAQAELRYGHNERLRHLAQNIVANQQQEISMMRRAIGEETPQSATAPAGSAQLSDPVSDPAATSHETTGMSH